MTRPDTCGEAGGAVSFWLKESVRACGSGGSSHGILSSRTRNGTGFTIYCTEIGSHE